METINKYSMLVEAACERVRRVKGIDVSFSGMEFYGIHKYSHNNVYKVNLIVNNKPLILYRDEESFKSWSLVPWSGMTSFKPADFDDWSDYKQLMLAWC